MINPVIQEIKVLVWDLDGTLYKSIPVFGEEMHKAFIKILAEKKNISFADATVLLEQTKNIYKSNTRSLQALGCGSYLEVVKKIEHLVKKASYLTVDHKLQQVFVDLSSFRHLLLSNTTHQTIVAELEALGLSHTIFDLVIGIDDTQTAKPDLSFFKAALEFTGLKPHQHLIIGDRIEVDLKPATQMGMKTCLVWTEEKKITGVDFCFPTVYDLVTLFKEKE